LAIPYGAEGVIVLHSRIFKRYYSIEVEKTRAF